MRIQVLARGGLVHRAAGLQAWGPGEHAFPDDPRFRPWLLGQVARGVCVILLEPEAEAEAESELPAEPLPAEAPAPRRRRK